ncbi:Protein of unknown function [Bacillus toyonensis]|nr:Protein of unknown function [Bacillus toyonensis]
MGMQGRLICFIELVNKIE